MRAGASRPCSLAQVIRPKAFWQCCFLQGHGIQVKPTGVSASPPRVGQTACVLGLELLEQPEGRAMFQASLRPSVHLLFSYISSPTRAYVMIVVAPGPCMCIYTCMIVNVSTIVIMHKPIVPAPAAKRRPRFQGSLIGPVAPHCANYIILWLFLLLHICKATRPCCPRVEGRKCQQHSTLEH